MTEKLLTFGPFTSPFASEWDLLLVPRTVPVTNWAPPRPLMCIKLYQSEWFMSV